MRPYGASPSSIDHGHGFPAFPFLSIISLPFRLHSPAPRSFNGRFTKTCNYKHTSTLVRGTPPFHGGGPRREDVASGGEASNKGPSESPASSGEGMQTPIVRSQSINYIAKGIKAASGFVKGCKAATGLLQKLQDPHDALLPGSGPSSGLVVSLKAAKYLAKGLKASKGIVSTLHSKDAGHVHVGRAATAKEIQERISKMAKALNAFYGAFRILQFMRAVGHRPDTLQLLHWSSVQKGYQLSKSVLNILDVVVGWKCGILTALGNSYPLLKGTVGAVGFVVQAAFLSKQLYIVLLKKVFISGGTIAAFGVVLRDICGHISNGLQHKMLCIPSRGYRSSILLIVVHPNSYITHQGISSLSVLVSSLPDPLKDTKFEECPEDDLFGIFSLAIPVAFNKKFSVDEGLQQS